MTENNQKNIKGEDIMKLKRLVILFSALLMLLMPLQTFAETSTTNDSCVTCGTGDNEQDPSVILDGEERLEYLNILESSELFSEKVSTSGVAKDTSQVIHMISPKEDVEVSEFILIAGTVENDDENAFYAFLDMTTNDVKRIIHMEVNHSEDTVHFLDWDYDGSLTFEMELPLAAMQNGEAEKMIQAMNEEVSISNTDAWWYSWACNFAGLAACLSACVAFIPVGLYGVCTTACSYVWGSSLC